MSRKQDFFAQDSEICFGIDMFRVIGSKQYGRRIRRYAWDKKRQMHVPAEFIKPKHGSIYDYLFELRINELEKQKRNNNDR